MPRRLSIADATKTRNRGILAGVLAPIASLALCVWGAAAAGLEISCQIVEAIFGQDTLSIGSGRDRDGSADVGGGAGANGSAEAKGGADVKGDGDVGEAGREGGDGDEPSDTGGKGSDVSGGGSTAGQRCFLNLICLSFRADANATVGNDALLDVHADAGTQGDNIDVNADTRVDSGSAGGLLLGNDLSALYD